LTAVFLSIEKSWKLCGAQQSSTQSDAPPFKKRASIDGPWIKTDDAQFLKAVQTSATSNRLITSRIMGMRMIFSGWIMGIDWPYH
jgi:hypothetical protein